MRRTCCFARSLSKLSASRLSSSAIVVISANILCARISWLNSFVLYSPLAYFSSISTVALLYSGTSNASRRGRDTFSELTSPSPFTMRVHSECARLHGRFVSGCHTFFSSQSETSSFVVSHVRETSEM